MSVSVMEDAHGVHDSDEFRNCPDPYHPYSREPLEPSEVATQWLVLPRNIAEVDVSRIARLPMTENESAACAMVLEDEARKLPTTTRLLQLGLALISMAASETDTQGRQSFIDETPKRYEYRLIDGINTYFYKHLGRGLISLGLATHFIASTAESETSELPIISELKRRPRMPPSSSVHSASTYAFDWAGYLEVVHSHLYKPDLAPAHNPQPAYMTKSMHLRVGIDTLKRGETTLSIRKDKIAYGLDTPDLSKPAAAKTMLQAYANISGPQEFASPVLLDTCGFEYIGRF